MNHIRPIDGHRGSVFGASIKHPVVFADAHRRRKRSSAVRGLCQRDIANVPRVDVTPRCDDGPRSSCRNRRLAAVTDARSDRPGHSQARSVWRRRSARAAHVRPRLLLVVDSRSVLVGAPVAAPGVRAGTSRWSSHTATTSPCCRHSRRFPPTISARIAAGNRCSRSERLPAIVGTCGDQTSPGFRLRRPHHHDGGMWSTRQRSTRSAVAARRRHWRRQAPGSPAQASRRPVHHRGLSSRRHP